MELALSLGADSSKPLNFFDKSQKLLSNKDLGFCMGSSSTTTTLIEEVNRERSSRVVTSSSSSISDHHRPPLHELHPLPSSPVTRPSISSSQFPFPWSSHNVVSDPALEGGMCRGFDVNRSSAEDKTEEMATATTTASPNSNAVSSFQLDFGIMSSAKCGGKRTGDVEIHETERSSSRASDDEENGGLARKKLRLSKEQSAFLEESFKEHSTLNPKQKLALAKQLNLRPRQVEVWFQNRRARTKLKQTEVDYEYLKRCCETLTEENRRLQKEVQELRALKTSQLPFFMHLPATTLTMCPSCERVSSTSTPNSSTSVVTATATANNPTALSLGNGDKP